MTQTLTMRSSTSAEARVVATIIRESFARQVELLGITQEMYPNYVGFETAERVQTRMSRGSQVALAFLAGKAIGTVSYGLDAASDGSGYIERMAVLPNYRGRGLGDFILEHAELMLVDFGARRAKIAIVAQFFSLQRFYERAGYAETSRMTPGGLPFEVLFMEKLLTQPT